MRRQPPGADPLRQFRRDRGEGAFIPKFVSELNARERDRLSLRAGERALRGVPLRFLFDRMNAEERRPLARALGRPLLRLAEERRVAAKTGFGQRPRAYLEIGARPKRNPFSASEDTDQKDCRGSSRKKNRLLSQAKILVLDKFGAELG
jgi:hypothetical protein